MPHRTIAQYIAPAIAAIAAAVALALLAPAAQAITYGTPDCTDNEKNIGCQHPNTVSLSGFRPPRRGEEAEAVSFLRCSGSLLRYDPEEGLMVILTAGHCASAYLSGLQDGSLADVGVAFDASIVRDLPDISPTVWSPEQYVLGGKPVLTKDYGPQGANASNIQFDYAVIVFNVPPGGLVTQGGTPVDPSAIAPVRLPPLNYLVGRVNAVSPLMLTAVGYGTGEAHKKPGDGGNADGAVNSTEEFGQRWKTELTAAFSFMGPEHNLLLGSQNPARGNEGTCGGDSGGPVFHKDQNGQEIEVGVTSSGDAICRATSIIARTDGQRAQSFLRCTQAGTTFAQIAACGCTSVDSQGECP